MFIWKKKKWWGQTAVHRTEHLNRIHFNSLTHSQVWFPASSKTVYTLFLYSLTPWATKQDGYWCFGSEKGRNVNISRKNTKNRHLMLNFCPLYIKCIDKTICDFFSSFFFYIFSFFSDSIPPRFPDNNWKPTLLIASVALAYTEGSAAFSLSTVRLTVACTHHRQVHTGDTDRCCSGAHSWWWTRVLLWYTQVVQKGQHREI